MKIQLTLTLLIALIINTVKAQYVDSLLVKQHLVALTKHETPRNYKNLTRLNAVADYIKNVFKTYADTVYFQEFSANGQSYKNVIASFGTQHKKRIIVGAHYDVCGDQQGADDNASGVTALLELARLLKSKTLHNRIDLVAYTLEEPPYFDTELMGSAIHANSLLNSKQEVLGMISVEMIGYFKDEKNSQDYPIGALSMIYGKRGNYITLVKKWKAGSFARKFCRKYKKSDVVKTKKFAGPRSLIGVDLSDHMNYWNVGISALMITDTSFYRNKNYHEATDTLETLDITRMTKVIDGIYLALIAI